jgi:hypothetical protein
VYLGPAVFDMNGSSEMRDDVVLQSPDDVRVRVPVVHSDSACPGAASAFVLRRIAYRAGAYAPGIQERLFHDLHTAKSGVYLGRVQGWMDAHRDAFHRMGYRFYHRWCAEPTEKLAAWVRDGRGYRGATLATEYTILHPQDTGHTGIEHAVGLAMDRLPGRNDDELVLVDPWPGPGKPDTMAVPTGLDTARRDKKFNALMFYWVGWS